MMPQTRLALAAVAAIAIGAAVLFFYVTWVSPVHRGGPPASLAKLQMEAGAGVVPDVAFADAAGRMHRLSEFRGHYVLLNLWASWCAPCVKELPALAGLKQGMDPRNFAVVPVDLGRDTAADAVKFLNAHQAAALPVYLDTNTAFLHAFGAFGMPLTVLIDRKGRERARAMGAVQWDNKDAIAWFKAHAS